MSAVSIPGDWMRGVNGAVSVETAGVGDAFKKRE